MSRYFLHFLSLFVLSLLGGSTILVPYFCPHPTLAQEAVLETYCDRIIDGWTLHSPDYGEIRFLALEPLDDRERRALELQIRKDLSSRVEGKRIRLEFEGNLEDERGRLQAYISEGGTLLNGWMLKNGYARLSSPLPPLKYGELFRELQREAQSNRRGVWGLASAHSAPASSPGGQIDRPPPASPSGKAMTAPSPPPARIVASKKSGYYYRPGQRYYDRVEPRYRLYFDSEEGARKAGFRPYTKQ